MHRISIFLVLALLAGVAQAQISSYSASLADATHDYKRFRTQTGATLIFSDSHSTAVTNPNLAILSSSSPVSGANFSISQHSDATGQFVQVPSGNAVILAGTLSSYGQVTDTDLDYNFMSLEQPSGLLQVTLASAGTYSFDITNIDLSGTSSQVSSKIDGRQVDYHSSTNDIHISGSWSAGTHTLSAITTGQAGFARFYPVSGSASANYRFSVQSTPEPASLSVLGLGAVALLRRRKLA